MYQALNGTAKAQPVLIINPQVPDQVQKLDKANSKTSAIVYRPLGLKSFCNIF